MLDDASVPILEQNKTEVCQIGVVIIRQII